MQHRKFTKDVWVVPGIVVSGTDEDISLIAKDSLNLGRVYKAMFGKDKFLKKRDEDKYMVLKIELDDNITGYTNVSESKEE